MIRQVLLVCAVSVAVHAADPPADKKAAKESPPLPTTEKEFAELAKDLPLPPWHLAGPNHRRVESRFVFGTVVDVRADFIEVQPHGKKEAVKYPPHVLLATGAVCHYESDALCYLLADVKKGDDVGVRVGTVDEEKGPEAFCIRVNKRPGDVVPASRKPSGDFPYHVNQQARNDHEEKGTPLPERMQPKWDNLPRKKPAPPEKKVEPPAGTPEKKK
jgi:hypothetical protein